MNGIVIYESLTYLYLKNQTVHDRPTGYLNRADFVVDDCLKNLCNKEQFGNDI